MKFSIRMDEQLCNFSKKMEPSEDPWNLKTRVGGALIKNRMLRRSSPVEHMIMKSAWNIHLHTYTFSCNCVAFHRFCVHGNVCPYLTRGYRKALLRLRFSFKKTRDETQLEDH